MYNKPTLKDVRSDQATYSLEHQLVLGGKAGTREGRGIAFLVQLNGQELVKRQRPRPRDTKLTQPDKRTWASEHCSGMRGSTTQRTHRTDPIAFNQNASDRAGAPGGNPSHL